MWVFFLYKKFIDLEKNNCDVFFATPFSYGTLGKYLFVKLLYLYYDKKI